jgi:hypothetical protein
MILVDSKQAFKNEDEYKVLKNAAVEFMDQYVRDIKLELNFKEDDKVAINIYLFNFRFR